MVKPDFDEFKKLSSKGNLIPIITEIGADLETPLSAFLKIDDGEGSFLLESVEGGSRWARYSFLGSQPRSIIKIKNNEAHVFQSDKHSVHAVDNITHFMRLQMGRFRPAKSPHCPEFYGGAVGFFSYDVVRNFEDLPNTGKPAPAFSDASFMITSDLLVFDNLLHKILLITTVDLNEFGNLRMAYDNGCERLDRMQEKLSGASPAMNSNGHRTEQVFHSNLTQAEYETMVTKAKDHIQAGDIIQVVLSQRFEGRFDHDPFSIYRGLRTINPSPYMFYLKIGDECLAGSSPETMVRMRNGEAFLRPIAGTRPRGADPIADAALEKELLEDAKETAEHVMLVDLARNDLGRIAQPGTVEVNAFKFVEKYSHVMHTVSNVKARPVADKDCFDIIKAVFPAGTLSGAPKIRAMEIIEDLEPEHRGPYGGCAGYFGFDGSMDMAITIRTVMMHGKNAYFQAGAGIVADSIPSREYDETMRKAEAMKRALTIAATLPGRLQ